MLNTQELANFISSKLNEISSQQGFNYVFDLGAEVLEDKGNGHIKGILRTVSNNPMVIKDFVSAKIQYRVEFSIPVGRANKNLINIENIIGIFVATYEDDEQAFTGGKASFEFTYAYSKDFSTQHSTGDTVPLGFDLVVNFTDTGLLGSSKIWMLDGMVIPYQTEAILLEKDGQTNRISEEYYNKSIMLAQTKFYKFTIPYDAGSLVCTTLQADLLAGDFDKTYTLTYYDGVNYTSIAPYTTTVSIFRSGAVNSDGGSISMFDITFADVSAAELSPKYTIQLFSMPFDEKNVRYFDSVEEQTAWFNSSPTIQRTKVEQIKAPSLNSIYTTTQVYDYNGEIYSQIQLANMNYARINEKKDTETDTEYTLTFEDTTTYSGTIAGSDGSSLDFEVVNTTPIIIEDMTYFLSVDGQGNYSLVDGGGSAITITDNRFVLGQIYYFIEDDFSYQIIDSNQNVITQVQKNTPVEISGISLTNFEETNTYNGLTLVGAYDTNNVIQYRISNNSYSANLNKRILSRSLTDDGVPNEYFWVETIESISTSTDPDTQETVTETTYSYKVIIGAKPVEQGNVHYNLSALGSTFVFSGVTYTLQSPYLITGSNNSSYSLRNPSADYYVFELDVDTFYMDTTDNNPIEGNQSGYLTFYDNVYNMQDIRQIGVSKSFTLDGRTFTLSISGENVKILQNGFVYADISTTHQFSVSTTYTITTQTISTTRNGVVSGERYIVKVRPATGYDYQFIINGITYYINQQENEKYNIYYSTGGDPFATNVENGGSFDIPDSNYNYYYYFVENADLGADKQIILSLKLDTVQTYLINQDLEFSDCFIEKAHLDRFIDNGDGTVSFNGGVESPLFEREEFQNVAKRLVSRKVLKYNYGETSDVEKWWQDNILGWIYAYLPKEKIKVRAVRNRTSGSDVAQDEDFNTLNNYVFNNTTKIDGQFIVFAAPLMKGNKSIILQCHMPRPNVSATGKEDYSGVGKIVLDREFLMDYLQMSTNDGIAYSVKFSTKPPYALATQLSNLSNGYSIDAYGNLVSNLNNYGIDLYRVFSSGNLVGICPFISDKYPYTKKISGEFIKTGCLHVEFSYQTQNLENYELLNPLTFPKLHTSYRDKTIYKISSSELSNTVPQTFIVPRPGINVEKVVVRLSYYVTPSNPVLINQPIDFQNKKGQYGYMNQVDILKVQILDSSIILTILNNPTASGVFAGWDSISIKERIYGIVGAFKNPIYNPKLLNSDYRTLKLTNERGSSFDYDIQKLNVENIESEITEPLTADIQRTFYRVRNTDGLYQLECSQNLTGLVETAETSMPLATTYVKQVLAEQPNYFNQRTLSNIQGTIGSFIGGSIAGGPIQGVASALMYAVPTLIGQGLSDDNMSKHADMVQNANGNVVFNLGYTTPGPTIEQHALLPSEERIINDQMFANGFTYNRIDNIKHFFHTRKYFNTIKAQVETMQGITMSNAVKTDLKERISNGIRLWHSDNIQYDLENYELWLEEE